MPSPSEFSGSTIGNLPIGQGLSVTPDADGRRLLGDRQRRHPAPAAADPRGGRPRAPAPDGHRVISEQTAAQLRRCSRACWPPVAPPRRSAFPATPWPGKTGTAQVAVDGGYSETQFVASFVGFAPAQDPRLLVAVVVDEPPGQLLRRRGRGPRVRRDRQVRAALSGDPPGPGLPPRAPPRSLAGTAGGP